MGAHTRTRGRAAAIATAAVLAAAPLHARVTRIVIDEPKPFPAADSGGVAFEQVAGRARPGRWLSAR